MEARKKRTALRSHIEEIKQWVEQNKYDEWIADALGTSPSSIQSFRSRQGISRRSSSGHGEGATQEGPVSAFEGVLDHGDQDGWGLWFDPAVAEDPIWREHWRGVDSVAVRISRDAIVLEPQESNGPSSENPEPQTTLEASAQLLDSEGDTIERGRIRWFDAEKGYGFITRPGFAGEDLFVHRSEVQQDPKSLASEQDVLYEIGHNDRGPVARKVNAAD